MASQLLGVIWTIFSYCKIYSHERDDMHNSIDRLFEEWDGKKIPKFKSNNSTTVYMPQDLSDVLELNTNQIIISDSHFLKYKSMEPFFASIHNDRIIFVSDASRNCKTMDNARALSEQIRQKKFNKVTIIGSGSLINLSYFVLSDIAKTINFSTTVIPSNTMSIADVAFGSLGMLNKEFNQAPKRIHDPDNIILLFDLFKESPLEQRRNGIIEVLKHCIFQKNNDITICRDAFSHKYVSKPEREFSLAMLGLKLKVDLIKLKIADRQQILNYGHSHGHAIERHTFYKIPHSSCVMFGILIDLYIAQKNDLLKDLLSKPFSDSLKNNIKMIIDEYVYNFKIIEKNYDEKYFENGKLIVLFPSSDEEVYDGRHKILNTKYNYDQIMDGIIYVKRHLK